MVEDPQVLIFDVNETLLDMSPLRTYFARVFGSSEPIGEWFARLLHGSLVANHTNRYRPFGTIGREALTVLGKRRGIPISQELAAELDSNFRDLPPHPDVASALTRLAAAGFRLVTLTNGSSEMAVDQLTNAQGKTSNSRRAIDLDPTTVGVLSAWKAWQAAERAAAGIEPAGRVFTGADGNPIHPHSISQTFERIGARAAVPRIRLHDIRHTHGTLLIKA